MSTVGNFWRQWVVENHHQAIKKFVLEQNAPQIVSCLASYCVCGNYYEGKKTARTVRTLNYLVIMTRCLLHKLLVYCLQIQKPKQGKGSKVNLGGLTMQVFKMGNG